MKKQIPIVLSLCAVSVATQFSLGSLVSAASLSPSLQSQMQRQSIIDYQNQKDAISRYNEEQLRIIRERNAQKLAMNNSSVSTLNSAPTQEPGSSSLFSPNAFANQLKPTIEIKVASYVATSKTPTSTSTTRNVASPSNIDMNRLEAAWLSWNNPLRSSLGLAAYTIDSRLDDTAQEWANFSRDRGYITHGRPGDGCVGETNYTCYNFQAIDSWFQERGVNPVVINRAKHTENLGIGSFNCTKSDCTDEAIAAIRKTYDFFYSEKPYDGAHYRSLVSPAFTKIGIGFAEKNGTYYVVVHYTTDF